MIFSGLGYPAVSRRNIPKFLWTCPFNEALTDIVTERFDAGIRIGERIERDMIAVRVSDELPFVVAGSPAYFAQRGKPKSPHDLVAHDCIRTRFASGTYFAMAFSGQTAIWKFTSKDDWVKLISVTVACQYPLAKALGSYKARPASSQRTLPKADS